MSRARARIGNVITALMSVGLICVSLFATTLVGDGANPRPVFFGDNFNSRPQPVDGWITGWALLILIVSNFLSILYVVKAFFRAPDSPHRTHARPIKRAPGTGLISLVEFLYPPKTVEGVFRPLVADWRIEHFDALQANRIWKARWVSLRYRISFVTAMGLSKAFSIVRKLAGK